MKNIYPTEEQEQRSFVEWLTLNGYTFTALGQSTPAGSMRGGKWIPNYKTISRNKAVGVRKGFPDMCIVSPDGRVAFVELKRRNGIPSDIGDEQIKWIDRLSDARIPAVVCFGAKEAIQFAYHFGIKSCWSGKVSSFVVVWGGNEFTMITKTRKK